MSETMTKETRGFETEVNQLLNLMVNALYSEKEIFLRELISNASDAADKLRFEALENKDLFESDADLKIIVTFDTDANTLTIQDNGIGMSRDEVVENLGTIARSGTKAFLETMSGDAAKDSRLIGQFGVGFYSSFMVAEKVMVKTRRAGLPAGAGVCWTSEGHGEYTIEPCNVAARGTTITLYMKPDETELLSGFRLRGIITKYADHINFPVLMKPEATDEEDKKEHPEFEVVNKATALWTLSKGDISDEEYKDFYKHVAHDFRDPLDWTHNKVEGKLEYTSLLYIPSEPPFDLFDMNQTRGLKLYVQRVFIMEDAEQLLPRYLRFVRGIVDSNDLPLNVSREILQSSRVIDAIKQGVTKRILSLLESMANNQPEQYVTFWKSFGAVLKEGPAEDFANKDRIAKLMRFAATSQDTDAQTVSFEDYVGRMKEGQKNIYYLAADSYKAACSSPHLEIFKRKGIEVLLLTDRVDEWFISHLSEFDGKPIQSIAKGSLEGDEFADAETDDKPSVNLEAATKDFESTLKAVEETLGERVKSVRLTNRLTESPACIVADEHDMSAHMERLLKAAGQDVSMKPILELNPEHFLVQRLHNEQDTERQADWCHLLLDQAILAEGGQLEDPGTFVKRFNDMLRSFGQD